MELVTYSRKMGSPKGHTNNANHKNNLTPFNSERAKAAAQKSAIARRERAEAKRAADAIVRKEIGEWVDTYKREQLGDACAAAAQLVAHKILNGEISDERALVQALPVLVDIARLEAGQHTSATLHATMSGTEVIERITALQARASQGLVVAEVIDVESPSD